MVKIGRNDPCPCGSGRKYKHCCYLEEEKNAKLMRAAARAGTLEEVGRILNERPGVFRLEVSLESTRGLRVDSTISRTFELEGTDSLYDLHIAIQDAFGWDNDHLFSFFMSGEIWDNEKRYSGDPLGEHERSGPGDLSKAADEADIGDLSLVQGSAFKYLFDYGDEIIHAIEVLDIHENDDAGASFPRLIQSVGDAPPQYR